MRPPRLHSRTLIISPQLIRAPKIETGTDNHFTEPKYLLDVFVVIHIYTRLTVTRTQVADLLTLRSKRESPLAEQVGSFMAK